MMPMSPSSLMKLRPFSLANRSCSGTSCAAAKLGEDGMAVLGRVVDGHLRVERDDLAVAGEHQRVHLDERGVELDERPVELGDHGDRALACIGVQLCPEHELARVEVADAERRIDVHPSDRVGVRLRRPPRSRRRPRRSSCRGTCAHLDRREDER